MDNPIHDKIQLTAALKRYGLLFACLLFFDLACTGSGRYLALGWFSPRILLVLLTLGSSLPLFFLDIRRQLKNPVNYMILLFLIWTAFEAVRGRQAGNNPLVWADDIKGFAWLGLIPLLQVLITDRLDLKKLLGFIIAGASVQAACIVIFNIFFAGIAPETLPTFVEYIWEAKWGTILACEYNAVRVFCRSSMYMTVSSLILFGRIMKAEKWKILPAVLFMLNLFGLFYTYTRSMYLSLALGLVLSLGWLLFCCPVRRVLLRTLILVLAILAVSTVSDLVLRQGSFQYAMARCFHKDLQAMIPLPHTWDDSLAVDFEEITKNSNETRDMTVIGLEELIAESPVTGHGLGATSPYRDTNDEYFYHDLIARCGLIGLVLYMLPAGFIFWLMFRKRKELKEDPEEVLILIAFVCFLVATYFNPWMNAAIGISWYGVTLRSAAMKGENNE